MPACKKTSMFSLTSLYPWSYSVSATFSASFRLIDLKNCMMVHGIGFFQVMQCGFAFLEAGSVRSKNTTNILLKNLLDSCKYFIITWRIGIDIYLAILIASHYRSSYVEEIEILLHLIPHAMKVHIEGLYCWSVATADWWCFLYYQLWLKSCHIICLFSSCSRPFLLGIRLRLCIWRRRKLYWGIRLLRDVSGEWTLQMVLPDGIRCHGGYHRLWRSGREMWICSLPCVQCRTDRYVAFCYHDNVFNSVWLQLLTQQLIKNRMNCVMTAIDGYPCSSAFCYPVVTRWTRNGEGWLADGVSVIEGAVYQVLVHCLLLVCNLGWVPLTVAVVLQDYAGSGVVHVVGGVAALCGAVFLGPRIGRFDKGREITGHSVPVSQPICCRLALTLHNRSNSKNQPTL